MHATARASRGFETPGGGVAAGGAMPLKKRPEVLCAKNSWLADGDSLCTAQHSAVAFYFLSDWCFMGAAFIFSALTLSVQGSGSGGHSPDRRSSERTMSAILRSRVARQVLTGTRGFASVPEVMVRERPRRDLDARCRPTVVERIFSLFPRRDATTRATASNPPASPPPTRSLTPHPRRASSFLSPRSAPPWCARPALPP